MKYRLPCTLLTAAMLLVTPAAQAAPSWQRYVIAPPSRDVRPVSVLSATGDVTNPTGLLGNGVTGLKRSKPGPKPTWPAGTTAAASSFHAPNNGNGSPRTYDPGNAIDGNADTFWNDDTENSYPDWLTLTSPQAVSLNGITVLSNSDGAPTNFTVETFDGSSWHTAATVTGNAQVQRAVRFDQSVSTKQVRITVTQDQDAQHGVFTRINEVWPGLVEETPNVVVDFGKVVVGYPKFTFAGASANSPGVRLAFSESTQYLSDRSDFSRSDFSNGPGVDQHTVTGPENWTDPDLRGFRYVRISLDAPQGGEVDISGVSLDFTAFLGTPSSYKGWFESSDEQLNQYWYRASYTNELCTDTFRSADVDPRGADSPTLDGKLVLHDGAKRDRDPYVGDIAVSGRTAYLTHDVSQAARNVLADLADHQRADGWIPPASINNYTLPLFEYPLWWVTSSWDYVLYTGDTNYASSYYPNLVKLLDNWYPSVTNSSGLLEKGLNGTGGYGDYAFLPRTGEVTYYNALYVQALKDAGRLADALSRHDDSTRWQQRANAVSAAINAKLWDPATKSYLDSSTGPVVHGQDGNGIAIMAGVADSTRAGSSLDYLAKNTAQPYGNSFMDNSSRVYAFTSYPEIEARFLSGKADSAIEEIKRLYGAMGTTAWEGIGPGGSLYEGAYTSLAHGWSTGVLPALTNDLLGVTPTGPGFSTWTVNPHPGSVSWARGQVPTPHGPLSVSWHKSGTAFTLTVTAPPGTSGDIVSSTGTLHHIGPGTHTVSL